MTGKTVTLFATSGVSSINNSVTTLKKTDSDLNWKEGYLLNRADEKIIRTWIEKLRYLLLR